MPLGNEQFIQQLNRRLRRWVLLWESPIWSPLLALVVYSMYAAGHGSLRNPSPYAFFNYLADAFLNGQLHLRLVPPNAIDLSLFEGDYYLYWPPLPAVLLMPFVALFGVRFSDITFTLGIAALNVSLVALMLRYGCRRWVIRLGRFRRALLVLFLPCEPCM